MMFLLIVIDFTSQIKILVKASSVLQNVAHYAPTHLYPPIHNAIIWFLKVADL